MQYTILLDRQEKLQNIEAQERNRFIKTMLESLGVPIEFDPDATMEPEARYKFNQDLRKYNLHSVLAPDGSLQFFVEKDLIGEWYKPNYKLKQDHSIPDRKKQLYLEMIVNFWTVFEEEQMHNQ